MNILAFLIITYIAYTFAMTLAAKLSKGAFDNPEKVGFGELLFYQSLPYFVTVSASILAYKFLFF